MKIALITGANGGFGKLITLELLKSGYIVIAAMRNLANKLELQNQVIQLGLADKLELVEMDVTNEIQIKEVSETIKSKYKKLDVLVNNAGYSQGGFFSDLTIEDWNNQYDTNVLGIIRTTKYFLELLEQSQKSHIINISSVSGYFGFPGMSAYCSSKFAVGGFSESLRLELLPNNIYVSVIEPTSYKTKIWEKGLEAEALIDDGDTFKQNTFRYANQSYQNASDPIEIAKLVQKICNSKRPKFRYKIGKGATSLSLIKKFVPWSMIEKVILRRLK